MNEEIPDKTVMQEWAESSMEFSAAVKKLLDEYGFANLAEVKRKISKVFTKGYLDALNRKKRPTYEDFPTRWNLRTDYITSIELAKAILAASALLETDDILEIIKWANA